MSINFRVRRAVGSPPKRMRAGTWTALPLRDMDVGDTVEVILGDEATKRTPALRCHVSRLGKDLGRKFSVLRGEGHGVVVVWRVA